MDGGFVSDSPRHGRDLGIGMVYQHLSLIPTLTVLENLMLGSNRGLVLDERAARVRLADLSAMLGVTLDPEARTGALALGQQQQIEIIKALWKGSRVLILDEPTSMLTPQGIAELQKVLLQLKTNGLAIIFITHKLHEAIAIGDRVAVLQPGPRGRHHRGGHHGLLHSSRAAAPHRRSHVRRGRRRDRHRRAARGSQRGAASGAPSATRLCSRSSMPVPRVTPASTASRQSH